MIDWKHQPAGVKRRPMLVYRRLAATTLAGFLAMGFGFYSLSDTTYLAAFAAVFSPAQVQADPSDGRVTTTDPLQDADVSNVEMPPQTNLRPITEK